MHAFSKLSREYHKWFELWKWQTKQKPKSPLDQRPIEFQQIVCSSRNFVLFVCSLIFMVTISKAYSCSCSLTTRVSVYLWKWTFGNFRKPSTTPFEVVYKFNDSHIEHYECVCECVLCAVHSLWFQFCAKFCNFVIYKTLATTKTAAM